MCVCVRVCVLCVCLCAVLSDWKGIYGSDAAAQKAAANEIRVMRVVMHTNLGRCLMSCLIHEGVHVMLASVVAPLSHATLTYGSADAGNTIITHDAARARHYADVFHLAPHLVRDGTGQLHEMWTAADVEFHGDYVCDVARMLPPTRKQKHTQHTTHTSA